MLYLKRITECLVNSVFQTRYDAMVHANEKLGWNKEMNVVEEGEDHIELEVEGSSQMIKLEYMAIASKPKERLYYIHR